MTVDFNVQYAFEAGQSDVLLSLDIYNLFNSQNPVQFNEDGDTGDYNLIRRFQEPMSMRLSARVSF